MPTLINFADLYSQVEEIVGWDFSNLQVAEEGNQPDFYDTVREHCTSSTVLLDIGMGDGKKILNLAPEISLLTGIDHSENMIQVAEKNLAEKNFPNVCFSQMDSASLQFPDDFFDVISCRHASFSVPEVARVLRDGGIFLTQQVSEGDKQNIKQAFGRGQFYEIPDGTLKTRYVDLLEHVGFRVTAFDYNITEYFAAIDDLMFLLKHTPIIPEFGKRENDFEFLRNFIDDNQTEQGIQTNAKRFVIIAQKPPK